MKTEALYNGAIRVLDHNDPGANFSLFTKDPSANILFVMKLSG